MKGTVLKWIIYIWGALSLYIFVAVRFQPMFNGLLREPVVEGYWDKTKYGEMYYFSMIRHFREKAEREEIVRYMYVVGSDRSA